MHDVIRRYFLPIVDSFPLAFRVASKTAHARFVEIRHLHGNLMEEMLDGLEKCRGVVQTENFDKTIHV